MSDDPSAASKLDVDLDALTFESNQAFQGWLDDKSKQMGSWKKGWTVKNGSPTTKEESPSSESPEPSQYILVNRQIAVSLNNDDDSVFTIYHKATKSSFLIKADNTEQRDEWISLLEQHGEYEDNDQYTMNVVEDDSNTVKIEVTHISTKQTWSASIENESQREHFQNPTAQWTLKVDDNTGLMTLSLTHPAVIETVLKMDNLKSIQKSPRTPKGDDDDTKDDDFKEEPEAPSTPEPVQRELTEQEKRNLESYKEFTFKLVRIEDSDQVRIEMSHIASGLDFQQSVTMIIPQKAQPVVVPHKEEDAEEVVDGAAVNKLFGNEDSDDSDDEENATKPATEEEKPKEEVVVEAPPPPPTMEQVLYQSKEDNALEMYLREYEKSPKTAYIELKFQLPDGEQKVFRLNQTQESIQRLVMKENEESYTLYGMAMQYTEETTSLLIEIKHLESGRDFEVTFGEEWLKKEFPEKYNPPPKAEPMSEPIVVPHNEDDADEVVDGAAVNKLFGNEDSDDSDDEDNATETAPIPTGAPIPTVPVLPQSEEDAVEDVDNDVMMEDVTVKKSESNDDAKEKEPEPEPTPEPEVNPLQILMECIQKSKASNTLKMTMKGWNKKASIELRFTFSATFNFNEKEKVISREEVIVVKRSKECIERQTEMEQKEEEQQEGDYIAGIQGVAESGYGQYCAIEGLVDRHTFKSHKNDKPDPQSVNSRKIMRELRKTLAKGVYLSYTNGSMFVRFDESNPRFLQAMLIGLKGTPYYNGCFLFDIYLPDEYPQKPCKVKHVSNGAQLCTANNGPGGFSPNLHKSSGKVCLSLLGTWSGPGWEPNKSNVYQLLSTLLLMVFGAEHPYYMEPSYGGWEGTAYGKTSHEPRVIQYDEEVLYHTAKSVILEMMTTKTYKGFEDIIKTHFRLKKKQIKEHMQEMLHKEEYSESFRKKVKPIYEQIEKELDKL